MPTNSASFFWTCDTKRGARKKREKEGALTNGLLEWLKLALETFGGPSLAWGEVGGGSLIVAITSVTYPPERETWGGRIRGGMRMRLAGGGVGGSGGGVGGGA